MNKLTTVVLVLVLILVSGGVFWLSNAPVAPATERISETLDDARIPH